MYLWSLFFYIDMNVVYLFSEREPLCICHVADELKSFYNIL